jgi:hypothetical protein
MTTVHRPHAVAATVEGGAAIRGGDGGGGENTAPASRGNAARRVDSPVADIAIECRITL